MANKRDSIVTKGLSIDLFNESGNAEDYLSLTDIVKYRDAESPADLIKKLDAFKKYYRISWNLGKIA